MKHFEDEYTRLALNKIRMLQESVDDCELKNHNDIIIFEAEDLKQNKKAIPITDNPKFGTKVLTNQIEEFRSSVESGAQFTNPENSKIAECPLIYLPETGNLIFSGIIPCLNNLRFQFVLKTSTGNGCFIWSDGLILNRDNIQILNKLFGYYSNWRDEWNASSGELESLTNEN